MKKIILSLMVVFLIVGAGVAQQKEANISFEERTFNFGKIQEDDGKVEHKFVFTNTGGSPLIITNVKASCGCTSPTWTEQPIMPGTKGYVSAVFDPIRRPGPFNKSISVESNSGSGRVVLRITGEVIPRQKTVEDYYPKSIGDLRVETNHFAFIKVYNNQVKVDTLKIYNSSDKEMRVSFKDVPEYLNLSVSSQVLKPKEKAYILGKYDGTKVNDWGFVTNRIKLIVNDDDLPAGVITVSAKIEEDFSKLSAKELANAPKIVFDNKDYDFGETTSKDKIEHTFNFKNEGNSDLIIHKVKATCGCTAIAPSKKIIKPGESGSFKAVFTPGSRQGKQRKSIYVISNDPKNSNMRLMISGDLK